MKFNRRAIAYSTIFIGLSFSAVAGQDWQGEARDAWIDGKLEASYLINTELDSFDIDTEVKNGEVTLRGTVPSATHKMLAESIAKNHDGVTKVNNQLVVGEVEADDKAKQRSDFGTRFYDMTTTASLKSEYAINSELQARAINIDTHNGVVTLRGEVESEAKKQLAEQIAINYDHVHEVKNELKVVPQSS